MFSRTTLVILLALGGSPLFAQDAKPVLDPVATAIWSEHARGMGDRGDGRTNVNFDLVTGKAFEFFEKFPEERRVGGILFNLSSFGGWMGDDPRSAGQKPAWQEHLRRAVADVLRQKTWPDNVWAGLQWVGAKNDIAIQVDATGRADRL